MNFQCLELQTLSVTTSSGRVYFETASGQQAEDLMIVNSGASGCLVAIGNDINLTAYASASANRTRQVYIPAGAVILVNKSHASYIAAITDSGTTKLYLHAGTGN